MTHPDANGCGSIITPRQLEQRLTELNAELAELDARLRDFSQAEDPAAGVFYAADIHALRQEKMQKRLEMDWCRAKIRFLTTQTTDSLQ